MPHTPLRPDLPGIRCPVACGTDAGRLLYEPAETPTEPEAYTEMGRRLAESGYAARREPVAAAAQG